MVLLDEPYGELDPPGFALLDGVIGELRARGATVIMATHLVDRGRALCDRALLLEEGRLAWSGPAARMPGATRRAGASAREPVRWRRCARTCCCSGARARSSSPSSSSAPPRCCCSASRSARTRRRCGEFAGGFLWLALLLASTLALADSFESEMAQRALEGLLLLPADPRALYYGKARRQPAAAHAAGRGARAGDGGAVRCGDGPGPGAARHHRAGRGRPLGARDPLRRDDRPGASPQHAAAAAAVPARGAGAARGR